MAFSDAETKPLALHVISGLGTGGAEMMLYRLLSRSTRVRHAVLSLTELATIGPRIAKLGIEVRALGMRRRSQLPAAVWGLSRAVARYKPDVIQGWMTHGNIAAAWAAAAAGGRSTVIWNVRQSLDNLVHERRTTRVALRLSALLSRRPARIVYNSRVSAEQHEAMGYPPESRFLVANGFDLARLAPRQDQRAATRSSLGVADDEILIGLIARLHPMKNHGGFLRMARQVADRVPHARFLLAGTGTDGAEMQAMIAAAGLTGRVLALGDRSDVPELTCALDIATNVSHGEAFPNVVGEAMACGVPCVVSDVGDSAWVVGDTGRIFPAGNDGAAVQAVMSLVDAGAGGRRALGEQARRRMEQNFSLETIVDAYEALYLDFARQRR